MMDDLENRVASTSGSIQRRLQRVASIVSGLSAIQVLILIGLFNALGAASIANYVAVVELIGALAAWNLLVISASLGFFLFQGIIIIFIAGWLSNNLRNNTATRY